MIIRKANIEDISGIKNLLDELYNYNWDYKYYEWQLFNNPNNKIIYVCCNNNEILGIFGLQFRTVKNIINCGQISWINVAKDYWRQGVFNNLYNTILSHCSQLDALFIIANKAAIIPCEKVIGLKFIGKLDRLVFEPKNKQVEKNKYSSKKIGEITEFPNLYNGGNNYSFDQDQKYFCWRYKGNPVYKYFLITTSSGDYSIVKLLNDTKKNIGDIVDYYCASDRISDYKILIESSIQALCSLGAIIINTWGIHSSKYRESLISLGFSSTKHSSYFGIKVLNADYNDLYNFNKWKIVMSDATNY